MFALPEVTLPRNVLVLLAVAAAESVMVLAVNDEMVAPEGMPVPDMGCPATSAVVFDTFEIVLLPVVTRPVIKLEPVPSTVVPAGMPVPVMGCPVMTPAVPAASAPASVTTELPAVRLPLREATTLEAVAGTLIVMVLPLVVEEVAVMVVPAGMPVPLPVMVCPRTTELMLDTVLMMLLPETVIPVAVAVLFAVAFALMVTVVTPTFVMTVLVGIPVPVRG